MFEKEIISLTNYLYKLPHFKTAEIRPLTPDEEKTNQIVQQIEPIFSFLRQQLLITEINATFLDPREFNPEELHLSNSDDLKTLNIQSFSPSTTLPIDLLALLALSQSITITTSNQGTQPVFSLQRPSEPLAPFIARALNSFMQEDPFPPLTIRAIGLELHQENNPHASSNSYYVESIDITFLINFLFKLHCKAHAFLMRHPLFSTLNEETCAELIEKSFVKLPLNFTSIVPDTGEADRAIEEFCGNLIEEKIATPYSIVITLYRISLTQPASLSLLFAVLTFLNKTTDLFIMAHEEMHSLILEQAYECPGNIKTHRILLSIAITIAKESKYSHESILLTIIYHEIEKLFSQIHAQTQFLSYLAHFTRSVMQESLLVNLCDRYMQHVTLPGNITKTLPKLNENGFLLFPRQYPDKFLPLIDRNLIEKHIMTTIEIASTKLPKPERIPLETTESPTVTQALIGTEPIFRVKRAHVFGSARPLMTIPSLNGYPIPRLSYSKAEPHLSPSNDLTRNPRSRVRLITHTRSRAFFPGAINQRAQAYAVTEISHQRRHTEGSEHEPIEAEKKPTLFQKCFTCCRQSKR